MPEIAAAFKGHPLALFPDFRRLFAGRVISAVGDKFFAIAMAWWVLSEAGDRSKLHLGLIMAVNVLPVILFGPLLGTLSDRHDKRRVMLWADAARGLLMLALAALLVSGALRLPLLYLICFLAAGFGPLFESATAASLLRLTSEEKMPQAVASDASVLQFSNVAGSALGSVLLAAAGAPGAFLFNAAGYAASFAAVWGIKTPLVPEARTESSFMAEFAEGLRYVAGNRPVLLLMLTFSLFNLFVSPLPLLIPMIVKFKMNGSVTSLALFETCFAAGSAALGLWLSFREGRRSPYLWLFGSALLIGLCFGALRFSASAAAACAALFAAGAGLGAGNTVAITLFQGAVPDEMKGRFFSVLTTVCYAMMPVAFMGNGLLAERFSVDFCLALNGAATAALSFLVLLLPRVGAGKP